MYYQISPLHPTKPVKNVRKTHENEVEVLKLVPFSALPKLTFENIKVGDTAQQDLLIENPNKLSNKLTIIKLPPADRNVSLSWIETEIEPFSSAVLHITWTPIESGSWRDVIVFLDSHNYRRNIPIAFKSSAKKVQKKVYGSKPTLKLKPVAPLKNKKSPVKKFFSPPNKSKRSPFKIPHTLNTQNQQPPTTYNAIYKTSPRKHAQFMPAAEKENSPIPLQLLEDSTTFTSPTNFQFQLNSQPIRRDTYRVEKAAVISPGLTDKVFDLEKKIQEMTFTPVRSQIKIIVEDVSFTPKNCSTEVKHPAGLNTTENLSNPRQLFVANDSYDLQNVSAEIRNRSSSTCISPEFKEPYTNVLSPPLLAPPTAQQLNLSGMNMRSVLSSVTEEESQCESYLELNLGGPKRRPEPNFNQFQNHTLEFNKQKSLESYIQETREYLRPNQPNQGQPHPKPMYYPNKHLDLELDTTLELLDQFDENQMFVNRSYQQNQRYAEPLYQSNPNQQPIHPFNYQNQPPMQHNINQRSTMPLDLSNQNQPIHQRPLDFINYRSEDHWPVHSTNHHDQRSKYRINQKKHQEEQDQHRMDAYRQNQRFLNQDLLNSSNYQDQQANGTSANQPRLGESFTITERVEHHTEEPQNQHHSRLWTFKDQDRDLYRNQCNPELLNHQNQTFDESDNYRSQEELYRKPSSPQNPFLKSTFTEFSQDKNLKQTFSHQNPNQVGNNPVDRNQQSMDSIFYINHNQQNINETTRSLNETNTSLVSSSLFKNKPSPSLTELNDSNISPASSNLYQTAIDISPEEVSKRSNPVSTSNDSFSSCLSFSNQSKRKADTSDIVYQISPPKRAFLKPKSPLKRQLNTTWSKKLEKKRNVASLRLSLNKSKQIIAHPIENNKNTITIDSFLVATIYSDLTATKVDPFICSSFYYDEKWMDRQIIELRKWLNALLTPPAQLDAHTLTKKVDVAKLFQESKKKELIYAPSKDKVSSRYHTNKRLDSLREAAKKIYYNTKIKTVLSSVTVMIENKKMQLREDKMVHLDVGLQAHMMSLFLCYNPLWLRIGLETIYNEIIPLESNSDVLGLSTFIMLRLFKDPYLLTKTKQPPAHAVQLPNYCAAISRFIFKKFLNLIYFLDQAKNQKLIPHDPCLFCKDAPIKETREILLSFSRECVKSIGDITKVLRRHNYTVSHKQTFIEEFDYAVVNLGQDLRDGIRLTKVMEIILLQPNLSSLLRAPPISRLQKVHNVKLALDSLMSAGYEIIGEISPKDIVDGHREKTMSLLWQIIYKFQAPRFIQSAKRIQQWWRSLPIIIKRKILYRPYLQKIQAAIKIQQFYRGYKLMVVDRSSFLYQKQSAIIIQRYFRSYTQLHKDHQYFLALKTSVVKIQRRFRSKLITDQQKSKFQRIKRATITLQRYCRALILRTNYLKLKHYTIKLQRNFQTKKQRHNFLQLKQAAITIQQHFRAIISMKQQREQFLLQKTSATTIQLYFRGYLQTKTLRTKFIRIKLAVHIIQTKFRALKLMKLEREQFLLQKHAVEIIQKQFRAWKKMQETQTEYLALKNNCIWMQRKFRANKLMKRDQTQYIQLKNAAITIQRCFRANRAMKTERMKYLQLKSATMFIQEHYRAKLAMIQAQAKYRQQKNAVLTIQHKFRATQLMKRDKTQYIQMKNAAITIQHCFRANRTMKTEKMKYLQLKSATMFVQEHYRAKLAMIQAHAKYIQQKNAVLTIQRQFRATQLMKRDQTQYIQLKNAAITIQRCFRVNRAMKTERTKYLQLKSATIFIQEHYRAKLAMIQVQAKYIQQKNAVLTIQRQFRANRTMKIEKMKYLHLKSTTIFIQQQYRAKLAMIEARTAFLRHKIAAVTLQRYFRAHRAMKTERMQYLQLKSATSFIQEHYRAKLAMIIARTLYVQQKIAVLTIQRSFRAYQLMKTQKSNYFQLKSATVFIQQQYRAKLAMIKARNNYILEKRAVILIQCQFRANIAMKSARQAYIKQKNASIIIQRYFRGFLAMKLARKTYLAQKTAVVTIQKYLRGYLLMKKDKFNFLKQKIACVILQEHFRSYLLMKEERFHYTELKRSTIFIQQKWRAQLCMKYHQKNYLQLKQATIIIQQRFGAYIAKQKAVEEYKNNRNAIIKFQQRFRAWKSMKICRENYLRQKAAAAYIQKLFRANKSMKIQRNIYLHQQKSAIVIQQHFRAYIAKKTTQHWYQTQRNAAILLQTHFRAYFEMKKARESFIAQRNAAIVIQTKFKSYLLMKQIQNEYQQQIKAVLIIQTQFRGYLAMQEARRNYLNLKNAALTIQLRYRAGKTMEIIRNNYLNTRKACVVIQQQLRAVLAMKRERKQYLKEKQAVIQLQKSFRSYKLLKLVRENYLNRIKAATTIQNYFKSYLAMKKHRFDYLNQKSAAIKIQNQFRTYLLAKRIKNEYIHMRNSVILIQRKYRSWKLMLQCRTDFIRRKNATIIIQRYYRSFVQMKIERYEFLNKNIAVIKIQQYYRGLILKRQQQKLYLEQKLSARIIQNYFRNYQKMKQERDRFLLQKKSCILIQRFYRNYLLKKAARTQFLAERNAAVTIQRYFRNYTRMRMQRNAFIEQRRNVIIFQKYARGFLARRLFLIRKFQTKTVIQIQSWWRMKLAQSLLVKMKLRKEEIEQMKIRRRRNLAATKIQTTWRGYMVRKLAGEKLNLIRQRSIEAKNRALPSDTLGKRNIEAINILMCHTSMKEILRALIVLDFSTRLFPVACVEVCDQIVELLYTLLANTNRSVPDLEVCILSTSVLINLKKFPLTSKSVWKPEFLETLLCLVLHWSDKDGALFPYLCTLLWLFAQDQEYCKIILKENNAVKMLQKSYAQCFRRQKMQTHMRYNETIFSSKENKIDFSFKSRCLIPSLLPDWGIINKKHPRTFTNPIYGSKCLLKKLNISINL